VASYVTCCATCAATCFSSGMADDPTPDDWSRNSSAVSPAYTSYVSRATLPS